MAKKVFKIIVLSLVAFFATLGFVLSAGFVALKMHWTDTSGRVDFNDRYFKAVAEKVASLGKNKNSDSFKEECELFLISSLYPESGKPITEAYFKDRSQENLLRLLSSARLRLEKDRKYEEIIKACNQLSDKLKNGSSSSSLYPWQTGEEWLSLRVAILKDKKVIDEASAKAGIKPRLLVSMLVVEQLRLFNSEREVFKQVFQPLKILGNQSQFSWGVMGLKEETAKEVEFHLVDKNSPYYLGLEKENFLKFSTADPESERFGRLVDEHEHYYSYFYASLLIKQLLTQWERAGFPIADRPEIIATLFNLGFGKSVPKASPQVGGAEIEIGGRKYTFGSLAYEFYYSGELAEEFPL